MFFLKDCENGQYKQNWVRENRDLKILKFHTLEGKEGGVCVKANKGGKLLMVWYLLFLLISLEVCVLENKIIEAKKIFEIMQLSADNKLISIKI